MKYLFSFSVPVFLLFAVQSISELENSFALTRFTNKPLKKKKKDSNG